MKRIRSHFSFILKSTPLLFLVTPVSCISNHPEIFSNEVTQNKPAQTLNSNPTEVATSEFKPPATEAHTAKVEEETALLMKHELDLASARIADHWFAYKVIKGDSLGKIARQYSVTISSLRKANKLRSNRIYAGQHLLIPSVSKDSSYASDIDLASIWDHEFAEQLAKESYNYGRKRNSVGSCLRGVRIALTRSMQKLGMLPDSTRLYMGRSAHLFKLWAINNIEQLCSKYKLVPIVGTSSRPSFPGLIYVYHRGRCGFSKRYGHVETIVGSNPTMACSDNCRVIKDHSCKPDLILAPCKYCPDSGLSKN